MDFKFDFHLCLFRHIVQIPWLFEDLLFRQAVKQSRLVVDEEKIVLIQLIGRTQKIFVDGNNI